MKWEEDCERRLDNFEGHKGWPDLLGLYFPSCLWVKSRWQIPVVWEEPTFRRTVLLSYIGDYKEKKWMSGHGLAERSVQPSETACTQSQ